MMTQISKMKLNALSAGFVADICFVFHDVEEDLLWCHSEKLAFAYGLLFQKKDAIIRIISKNMRVCGDCHAALLLFSRLYKCEFIVRDRSRNHHFKDSLCSCNNF